MNDAINTRGAAPKLTEAQRAALQRLTREQPEKWNVTAPMQLRLTDAGRAALRGDK